MDKLIAYCGINCFECPALPATQKDDDNERKKVAEQWSKEYNADVKPEDINCLGCMSDTEPIFKHAKICEIRKCARDKGLENCAYCDDYICDKLRGFFKIVPTAMVNLENIRTSF